LLYTRRAFKEGGRELLACETFEYGGEEGGVKLADMRN
jgi:hypothetical protein